MFIRRLAAARDEAARAPAPMLTTAVAPSADDEVAARLLDYLEHLDDSGWAEAREFERRALPAFSRARGGGPEAEPRRRLPAAAAREHTHAQHALHLEWCAILEQKLERFAVAQGMAVEGVAAAVARAVEPARARAAAPHAAELLGAIASAVDFASWSAEMRRAAEVFECVLESERQSPEDDHPPPKGAQRGYCNLPR